MIEVLAIILTLSGEFTLGFGKPELVVWAYVPFILGDILWIWIGIKKKVYSISIVNLAFLFLGLRVIINWF